MMFGWLHKLLGREEEGINEKLTEPPKPEPTASIHPLWLSNLPPRVLAIDVETTGLHSNDRVVSFAGILLETEGLAYGDWRLRYCHLLFDPCKKSHPRAVAVHGYSDWLLRHQDLFTTHADTVGELLAQADLVVAHNAGFDTKFINRELALSERPLVDKPVHCTMDWHRAYGPGGPANLSFVAGRLGFQRTSHERHGALEDAWLALMVYLAQHGCPHRFDFSSFPDSDPSNIKPTPPQPEGSLPRTHRRRKKDQPTPTEIKRRRITTAGS